MIRRGVFGSVLLLSSACGDAGTGTGGETATAGPTSTTTTTTTATTTSTSGTPTTSTSGMSGTESTTQAPTTGTTAEPTTTAVATSTGEPGTTTTTGPGTTTTSEPGTTSTTEPDTTGDESSSSSSSTTTTSGGADDPPPPPDELAGCQSCECCEPWWISWGEVPGATHYRVRWKCSINPEQVHDVGNVTMIADVCTDIEMCNGMCAFTVGYVRVEACNPDGCSAPVDIPGIPITCGGGCCC